MAVRDFTVVSSLPEVFDGFIKAGVVGQAISRGVVGFSVVNPREFSTDRYKTIDDRPFGGGDGMVLMAEPMARAIRAVEKPPRSRVVYLTPQGAPLTHGRVQELSQNYDQLCLVCGRYGGVDERLIQKYCDEELSIGDYVVSGGEVAAMVLVEAVARYIPGVLGNVESVYRDSFGDGLLEGPVYTRPSEWEGLRVPATLTSGDHQAIAKFREYVSCLRTFERRPDLWMAFSALHPALANQRLHEARQWQEGLTPEDRRLLGLEVWPRL